MGKWIEDAIKESSRVAEMRNHDEIAARIKVAKATLESLVQAMESTE